MSPEPIPVSNRTLATDAAAVLGLGLVALSALASAYGGWHWLVAATAGLVAGLGLAEAGRRFKLAAWPLALAAVATYFLVGSLAAVPDEATAGFVPNLDTVRRLAEGAISGWRESLTGITPLGTAGAVLVVPFVVSLVATLVAGTVLWRTSHGSWALIPVVGLFVVAAAFGDVDAGGLAARGIGLAAGLLCWLRWRSLGNLRVHWGRRIGLSAALLGVAGAAAVGVTVAASGEPQRDVLREHVVPPFDPLDYKSPLSAFRSYQKEPLKDAPLFTVDGLPAGTRVRLAAMDTFDGVVWNVTGGADASGASGSFTRLPKGQDGGDTDTYAVTIGDYRGVWVPSAGDEATVELSGLSDGDRNAASRGVLVNGATGTMAQVGGVHSGATYTVTTALPPVYDDKDIVGADAAEGTGTPAPAAVPEKLASVTAGWAATGGGSSAGAIARAMEKKFQEGYYSDGLPGSADYPSNSGHGSKRLSDLFDADELVGNAEQYASAMGVALQRLGVPSRVVIGFVTPPEGQPVTGNDVTAWVQVDLEGLGWVDFLPTPSKDRTLNEKQDTPDPQPQPQVMQPPDRPDEAADDDDVAQSGGVRGQRETDPPSHTGVPTTALLVGGGGLLLLSPIPLILLAKSLRRRRRRRDPDPVNRMSGGWREVTDRALELGARLPDSNTRYENAVALAERFPVPELATMATSVDSTVFGVGLPTDEEVADYWRDVATARRGMRRSASWRHRLLSPISLSSFRRPRLRAGVARLLSSATKQVRSLLRRR
jgi:hypothetical protein